MDTLQLASGDSHPITTSLRCTENKTVHSSNENNVNEENNNCPEPTSVSIGLTPQIIHENETKLKERISQCRNVIESLKHELNEEKSRLEKEGRVTKDIQSKTTYTPEVKNITTVHDFGDLGYSSSSMYSTSVDNKLNCDENLIEYEKQLQKYQNTLNMAQMEKKNAIRKQMLTKAYKLKLLEVENQCNIELLRVKQSLQCLEPLQMIANKWKSPDAEDSYDCINFELLPRFPELSPYSGANITIKSEQNVDDKNILDKIENISLDNTTVD